MPAGSSWTRSGVADETGAGALRTTRCGSGAAVAGARPRSDRIVTIATTPKRATIATPSKARRIDARYFPTSFPANQSKKIG